MNADGETLETPQRSPIAGFWRRLAAFVVDSLVLAFVGFCIGSAFPNWAAELGQSGRLVGFVIALAYFGVLDSRVIGGKTIGKWLLQITVVSRSGDTITLPRSVLRFLVIAVPYFLNGVWFGPQMMQGNWPSYFVSPLLSVIVLGGNAALLYLFIFNRRTGQSLHDLAAGTFVIHDPPAAIPNALFTPRLHIVIVGCLLALTLIAGIPRATKNPPPMQKSLFALQAAIQADDNVRVPSVSLGFFKFASINMGASTTTNLQITAHATDQQPLNAIVDRIAATVLQLQPNLFGRQILIVAVSRGYDLGIFSWSDGVRDGFSAANWHAKLAAQAKSNNLPPE